MKAIGLDSGSSTTKGVLIEDGKVLKKVLLPTGPNPGRTLRQAVELLDAEGAYIVTTGYGRDLLPEAQKRVTEITCHGRGASYLGALTGHRVRTIIDIGGQDSKVIALDSGGKVCDFVMNDKCAAGTGRFVEVIMRLLHQDLEDLDQYIHGAAPEKISSMCTVFAESEVISLLAQNKTGQSIACGVIHGICERTANFSKKVTTEETVFFSGGLAVYDVFVKTLGQKLGLSVIAHELSQYAGAIGAALIGIERKE